MTPEEEVLSLNEGRYCARCGAELDDLEEGPECSTCILEKEHGFHQ